TPDQRTQHQRDPDHRVLRGCQRASTRWCPPARPKTTRGRHRRAPGLASRRVTIPLFDMCAELAAVRPELDAAIARVLDSGVLIGGPEIVAFERELAAATGAR